MKKIILVISDVHMCEGRILEGGTINVLEDFLHDRQLANFLEYYSTGSYSQSPVELVLNGDFLNLIQVPWRGQNPSRITERVSLEKLELVLKGHSVVFNAMKRFNQALNHSVSYVIGNHDLEMIWPSAKRRFAEEIGGTVNFFNALYIFEGVHIEHGHQLEATNHVDPKRHFIQEEGLEWCLNLPWGTLFVLNVILRFKKHRPVIDKVKPFFTSLMWILVTDFLFGMKMIWAILAYFFKTRFTEDEHSSQSRTTLAIISDFTLNPDLSDAAEAILQKHSGIHTVVFGHTHLSRYQEYSKGKIYLNTGTWNEVTSLDLESFGRNLRLTYAYIEFDEGRDLPLRQLKEWKGQWLQEIETYG